MFCKAGRCAHASCARLAGSPSSARSSPSASLKASLPTSCGSPAVPCAAPARPPVADMGMAASPACVLCTALHETTAHPSPVHRPQELTPKHACQLSRGLCGVVRSALAGYSVVQRVSCRGEPAVDPLTGKSISLLKLSPAEEDIVWVYENFSYSCEWPAFAVSGLG